MITGIETLALAATDIGSISRVAQQIVSPLVQMNGELVSSGALVNPDEVRHSFDKVTIAINSVNRKLYECNEIINSLNEYDETRDNGFAINLDFPNELRDRAEVLSSHIETLKVVFSLVETSPSWKPYFSSIQTNKSESIRAVSNLRNAYLNIALIAEQFTSPIPTVESSVEGTEESFAMALSASRRLLRIKTSGWR
ncbi:hypothetical protein LGZ99_10465 [Photorhabdus temperata]|uniref:Uncharacterized protein n=2 Tax=Photorhabdus temperata TaxID=574560 RepID=A0A081RW61_PHOTE|nr:hypothetical protein [Photorhabdus temperata]ERT13002.1 hypothetical protein O185_11270 [Photorhabdus temperata J3]KER02914.1 hypothetical protein MEG1DRAFT_02472 [Photorhabdus temperata subsp. temperata Meg1]MCT8347625.1 hypothetical protein [Photorhabdus temperata]